ncbi:MAG TPA: acyltransferase [Acidimicrobiales bacterium]|nr:acyltransferase [Acidimicrobiales bacterium]
MPALDGLRGLAVFGVLLFHAQHLKGGWLGVDLFFVLSGFLITSLLLTERQASGGRINLVAFWGRRARRLFPALLLLILGVGLYALFVATPFDLSNIRSDGLFTVFYAANWHSVGSGQDYFQLYLNPSPFQHTWSLAIEEQFYVVWPLVIVFATKIRRASARSIAYLAGGMAAISVVLMIVLSESGFSTDRLYYGTDTRASSLLFGATLAAWRMSTAHSANRANAANGAANGAGRAARSPRTSGWAALQIAGLYAFAGLMAAWFLLDGQSSFVYRGGLALCGLAAAIVVAAASTQRLGPIGRLLSWRPLRGLGLISYGVYLYHWPIFLVVSQSRTGLSGWPLFVLQFAATLAAAIPSYYLVERPIRSRKILTGRFALASIPAAAAIAVTTLLVTTVGAESIDINVPPSALTGILAGPKGAPVIMILGDSTASSLAVQMGAVRDSVDVSVADRATDGCGPIYALGPVRNAEGAREPSALACGIDWEFDARVIKPKVALVLFGFPPVNEVSFDGGWQHACTPTYDSALQAAIVSDLRNLTQPGTHVVISLTPDWASTGLITLFPKYTQQYIDCQNAVIQHAAASVTPAATVLDINQLLCPHGLPCPSQIDGQPTRQDGLHFRSTDGPIISAWVVQQLAPLLRHTQ